MINVDELLDSLADRVAAKLKPLLGSASIQPRRSGRIQTRRAGDSYSARKQRDHQPRVSAAEARLSPRRQTLC